MPPKTKPAPKSLVAAPAIEARPGRDLDQKYRPRTLDGIVGQPAAVAVMRSWGQRVPRCVLFTGGPGTGKTSSAKILAADVLKCATVLDVNCGLVENPIDYVRTLRDDIRYRPLNGGTQAVILDEAQTFSRAPGAAQGLLKVLEDCPDWVWFFLASTDPQKILPAIISRCVTVDLKDVADADLTALVRGVAEREGHALDADLLEGLVSAARGSPRAALKYLEKVMGLPPEDALAAIGGGFGEKSDAFALARAVIYDRQRAWPNVAQVLSKLEDEDPEGLRRMLLTCGRKQLLAGKEPDWVYRVILCLEKPLFDRGTSKALLAALLYECFKR